MCYHIYVSKETRLKEAYTMKNYILRNKLLLFITLIAGAIYSVCSTLIAFIIRELMDVSVARDRAAFFEMLVIVIIYVINFRGI